MRQSAGRSASHVKRGSDAKASRAEARLVYHFIDPAYVPFLVQRHVDLDTHQPVVMARASAKLRQR